MKKATAVLLNWQRPENQKKVITSIGKQTIGIDIFLWNNNREDESKYDVDLLINSGKNLFCWPRWMMGSFVETEFVFSCDDDLLLKDSSLIEDCCSYLANKPKDTIIGFFGVILGEKGSYWEGEHIKAGVKDKKVDIVKGRFMFMRTSFLSKVRLPFTNINTVDDIYISSYSSNKIVPNFLSARYENLKEGDESLSAQSNHELNREKAVLDFFGKKEDKIGIDMI